MILPFFAALALASTSVPRAVSTSANGITKVVIVARAGSLEVNGVAGATEIKANGTADAPSDDTLKQVQLVATRSGSQVTIEAEIPDGTFLLSSPQLDFTVTLPAGMPVVIHDSSGEMTVKNVGELDVKDSSGSIDIDGVTGNVRLADSSGSIEVEKVTGSVTITEDGSGSVTVKDVRGDFTVQKKGSGHVDYERIGGKVSVPPKH
jgi:hypothetical protein